MPRPYRVGIIGATGRGNYGHSVDTAFLKVPQVEIVAVADAHAAGLETACKRLNVEQGYADYREMLQREKLDIVAICPRWIDQHHEMLMAAISAGCHVYMEKPFCRDLVEADEVVQHMQMRHLHLGIAHIAQYSPVLNIVLKLIEAGEIGEVLEIHGRGKEDRRGGGEDLWVLGSHVFGQMRSLGGGQPLACTARVWQQGDPVTREHVAPGAEGIGPLAGDHIEADFEFSGQIKGRFSSRKEMGGNPSRFGVQVFGSQGIIQLYDGYLTPAYLLRDSSWSPGRSGQQWQTITSNGIGKPETRTDGNYLGGHLAAINDLIDAIESQRPTRCNAEDCRDIVEMTAAIFESHRLDQRVSLPLNTRFNPLTLLSESI